MKIKLRDVTDVVRSKNSGPFELTFDIIFKDWELFHQVNEANVFNKELFASLYQLPVEAVISVIAFTPAKAFKATIKRPLASGDLGETDVYGAQQHVPLLELEFEL